MRRDSSIRWLLGLAAALCLLVPSAGLAQPPTSSFEALASRLRVGDTIYVTDAANHEQKGTLHELSVSQLVLDTGGDLRRFPEDGVQRVRLQGPNPLGNGALIGFAIGAGLGVVGMVAGCAESDCTAGGAVLGIAMLGGIGAGIGVGIDAAVPGKKILIYQGGSVSSGATVGLSPIVAMRRQGLALSIGF